MFRAPHNPQAWVGFVVLWAGAAVLVRYVFRGLRDEWRRHFHRDSVRIHAVLPKHHRVDTPHWTRDPSPRPRLGNYDWRAIAEGDIQR